MHPALSPDKQEWPCRTFIPYAYRCSLHFKCIRHWRHRFCVILEDHTDFAVTTLIKRKSKVDVALTNAIEFFETQYATQGFRTKRIRSDNGGEYKSHHLAKYCASKGIIQEFLSLETP